MLNKGLFSSLFIADLKCRVALDDAARGRMATLAQTWRTRNSQDTGTLWESFLKQALSYLEFVPPGSSSAPGVYPLFEDWGFNDCIGILYLAPPATDFDGAFVGSFYPARLLAQLRARKLNWGILTNGALWRLYSTRSSRPFEDCVELDLEQALETANEAEYGLFERFFHKDALIAEEAEDAGAEPQAASAGIYTCRLDRDREQSEQVLEERVKKPFLAQVDEVLQYICNGFIYDTSKSGEEYTEDERAEIFESAVKLIYRGLFLFYAEARRLLPSDSDKAELYRQHSIQALCREARRFRWGERRDTDQYDLWKHLQGLINAVNEGDPEYGVMGYNGGLFDDETEPFLGQHQLRNDFLCRALYLLAFVEPLSNDPKDEYAIPYEDLEVRHLGELYENILECTVMLADADRLRRRTKKGVEILLATQTTRKPGDTLIKRGEVYFGESALERKQTGSYYTPESLVRFLNEKTIIQPLIEKFEQSCRQRFDELLDQAHTGRDGGARRGAAQAASAMVERFVEEVVLTFKVCDPAMGSGHFLVDAANQMAGFVVSLFAEIPAEAIRDYESGASKNYALRIANERNDSSSLMRNFSLNYWRRQITRHCIYGVDLNPLAVNLAKLALWLNCFAVKHRLTFLDHHIRCGNSLIGIRALEQLVTIPERKKGGRKKDDRIGELFPDFKQYAEAVAAAGRDIQSISEMDEDDTDEQKATFERARQKVVALKPLADLYTAYLMDAGIRSEDYNIIFYSLAQKQPIINSLNPDLPAIAASVQDYQARHHFFHWPLEFPDVFPDKNSAAITPNASLPSGFAATIGNPPWDIIKPSSQEFFLDYDSGFRSYKKQEANTVSQKLMADNPSIAKKWKEYCDGFAEQSAYFKEPANYSSLGKGDINTFKLFLEQFFTVLGVEGRMGIVVPSGIYTDQGCQPLRELFFNRSRIEFLYCFENRWPTVFSAVDGRFKFVTFGIQKGRKTDRFKCAFMEHDPERLPLIDADALMMSVRQVKKFSPETLSVMEFKSQRDVDVTTKIYGDWPLLGEKLEDTWNVKFNRELDMTNAIHLLTTEPTKCPLYEGKMIWQFDSDFSESQYWCNFQEAKAHVTVSSIAVPRLSHRRISASTNERTLVASFVPANSVAETNCTVIWLVDSFSMLSCSFLCGVLNSFCLDFIIRKKVMGTLNMFYMESLPVLREAFIGNKGLKAYSIIARALRLVCTQYAFADLWDSSFSSYWQSPDLWYPPSAPIDTYGPAHEQEIRKRLRDEAQNLTPEWGPHCGVHDRLPDRRDTGDRAQLRAEIDAYVAHLYGLSRDDFAYILDTFTVLRKKEKKAFGEFMSRRKCLEEYDRIKQIVNAEL